MSLESEIKKIGTFFVTEIAKELATKDKKASGKLLRSIRSEVKPDNEGYELAIWAESYFKFVDKGVNGRNRRVGSQYSFKSKKPPLEPLLQWVKTRAIASGDKEARSAAFAIQNHIYKNGFKGLNFFDKFIDVVVEENINKLTDAFLNNVSARIDKVI